MKPRAALTAGEARRVALAAQMLADPADTIGEADGADLRRLFGRLGVVQLDSVNVLARSHYLPPFARLGAYPRDALEVAAWGARPSLFEYWGHEASLMPMALQPLLRWRMQRARDGATWASLAAFAREQRPYVDAVLERIAREGPLTGGDFAEGPRGSGWWNWSAGKRALEWLFWAGFITTRTRRGFERVYDLTERVLPRAVIARPTPTEAEAHRGLLRVAAAALGVATEGDLRDYFRLPAAETRARLAEMVEAGELHTVSVDGWSRPALLWPAARLPRRVEASALLSPFDNLIWRRERAERLFGARIRLEIYTPAAKRAHGYYVLPLLDRGAIVGRVDLKADRGEGLLRAQAAHLEAGCDPVAAATAMGAALRRMAAWLGLRAVAVEGVGDLAAPLRRYA